MLSLVAALAFLALSSLLYWPTPEVAFRTDESPAAWLSSAQLWAMALLSLRLWGDGVLPRALCLWLGVAMMGMAFDEQFMLHEHWKYGCVDWFESCRMAWVTELPMLLVAAGGAATVLWLHRCLPSGLARGQLWLALAVGLFALYMRFFGHALLPYKAAFLVLAQALFAGLLLGLRFRSQVHSSS
ncbi:MAG: hypothetical protein ACLGI6_07450 [Gammaproteobacteria bacterium]